MFRRGRPLRIATCAAAALALLSACGSRGAASSPSSSPVAQPTVAGSAAPGSAASSAASSAAEEPEPTGTGTGGLVVYNAQHENLTQAWAEEFTKETGITGRDAQRQRQRAGQPAGRGGVRFTGRRVPDRELARDEHRRAGRSVRAGGRRHRRAGPGAASTRRPATGSGSPPGRRSSSTTPTCCRRPSCRRRSWICRTRRGQGKWAASPSGADFQAIVSAILELKGADATTAWLDAMKTGATRLPRQHHGDEGGQRRRDPGRRDLPLLLVRRPGRNRREQQQDQAAVLGRPGSRRVRERVRWRRAGLQHEAGRRRSSS